MDLFGQLLSPVTQVVGQGTQVIQQNPGLAAAIGGAAMGGPAGAAIATAGMQNMQQPQLPPIDRSMGSGTQVQQQAQTGNSQSLLSNPMVLIGGGLILLMILKSGKGKG